jgi:hypothetical protein
MRRPTAAALLCNNGATASSVAPFRFALPWVTAYADPNL